MWTAHGKLAEGMDGALLSLIRTLAMKQPIRLRTFRWTIGLTIVLTIGGGAISWSQWSPRVRSMVRQLPLLFLAADPTNHRPSGHDHENHQHRPSPHDALSNHEDTETIKLSSQALRNVGLTPDLVRPVELSTFRRAITVPAVIVEKPGRTQLEVATPMTGVVTYVHAVEGEAVEPGSLLFKIRLTHEDLVKAQTDFLKSIGELDVVEREISRLSSLTSGAIAGKVLLEREYARDKLTALINAQREALRLHGLSKKQVDQIATERRLLRELQIVVPTINVEQQEELMLSQESIDTKSAPTQYVNLTVTSTSDLSEGTPPLLLHRVDVHKGQSVNAGETLCVLADFSELYIEGLAFEQDISQLRHTYQQGWKVEAVFDHAGSRTNTLADLEIAYLSNKIDADGRTLQFYVRLPNHVAQDRRSTGTRFVTWEYVPGQRLQLRVPIEEWPQQMVIPVTAIARQGAEYFVFEQHAEHFDRVPVHVKYKDQHSVVIESDGTIAPGDKIAMRGAHQMQMALQNKTTTGVDPHAGHDH